MPLKATSSELNHVSKKDIIKEGGSPRDVKDPDSGVEEVEGGWVPRSVVSLREGLREGRRRQKVTRLVGTKRGSVVGTRWVPREGLREGCRG